MRTRTLYNRTLFILIIVSLALGFINLQAQTTTSTLTGTLTDMTAAAAPGVQVTLINLDTNVSRSSLSDATGLFRFEFLPAGNYKFRVEGQGLETLEKPIVLKDDQILYVDLMVQRTMLPQNQRIPFPEVRDWKSVRITLARTECLGSCPGYQVQVHGDGTVIYEGSNYVAFKGRHRASISQENLRQLVNAFRDADYYSLLDQYYGEVTDVPLYETSIKIDGRSKKVTDYFGQSVGMPETVSKLEHAIDRLTGTERWTKGNAETIASLQQEKWNFKSAEAAATLARVVQFGNVDAVRALVAAGVSVSGGKQGEDTLLMRAAASGVPDLVKLFLRYNPDINAANTDGETALMRAASPNQYPAAAEPPKGGRAEVVRLLLAAGADVNARTKDGRTALMEAGWDADVALLLIKAGSNVNAQDKEGYTPLMSAAEADVAQVLLDKGADPTIRNAHGETALDMAREDGRQEVETLLKTVMAGKK